jgi:uncharacterized NAD(P)/FAD-binding protein YdhS
MPESAAQIIESAKASGYLDVGAGRISSVAESSNGFEIFLEGSAKPIPAHWVLNCTGPSLDIKSEKIPILESMVSAGLARYDPLGLGLMVDNDGSTESSGRVWALGPICRGCRWETTAIPEIRVQAANLAAKLSRPVEDAGRLPLS